MSKEQLLNNFLLENASEKRIYIDEDKLLYITVKGLSLAEIIVGDKIMNNLWKNIGDEGNNGSFVTDELAKDIANNRYETTIKCLVDQEDVLLLNPEKYEQLPEDVKNEIIFSIIELTIPSKKKLLIMKNLINRVDNKAANLLEIPLIKDLMKKRSILR